MIGVRVGDHALAAARDALLQRLVQERVASRLGARDYTLWGPAAETEAQIRLDWVNPGAEAESIIVEVEALRAHFDAMGVDRIVLCGMGGSSLAPEVICTRYGVAIEVLDSTHPGQVKRALEADLTRTAVVVSSKSGSTIETRSHLISFEAAFRQAEIEPAARIVVVTDPDSPLEQESVAKGYRVFRANPRVGGRFSALTAFGLVPAGLAGADVRGLIAEAISAHEQVVSDSAENPALQLAAAIAVGLPGRYALVLHECENEPAGISAWIEQLLAESTGKQGKGVLPVAVSEHSPEAHNVVAPESAIVLNLEWLLEDPSGPSDLELEAFETLVFAPLGAQLLLWEYATAVLGHCMGINPFSQPDVESAKAAARELLGTPNVSEPVLGELKDSPGTEILAAENFEGSVPSDLAALQRALTTAVPQGGYLSIQAYLDHGDVELSEELLLLRDRIADQLKVPVTLGWGPRFLHSTGQLHKGGPALGVFLQIQDHASTDMEIATMGVSFGQLIAAQALGDRNVLAALGRPILALRVNGAAEVANLFSTQASDQIAT